LSGGGGNKTRRAQNRAGEIRAAAAADPHRLSDVAAIVGQGAGVHRSRHRDQRLAFRWARLDRNERRRVVVMAGLVPAIHVFIAARARKTWMPGTGPGMTARKSHIVPKRPTVTPSSSRR